ncbi:MAG: FAD-dependent monooxygenase [Acidobacteriota bacterium]|nr:FAD-dependent monooxygenase [Acidobacteriota bacterium]
MTTKPKILIVGAGIGGLATAIALRQAGFDTAIYENAPVLRGIGAGITLWSNATAVLEKLGLLEEAVSKSAVFKYGRLLNERGELLQQVSTGNYPTPAICIHRADLIDLLKRKCSQETIHLGKTFEHFEQDETGVTAFFADGTSAKGGILIGADGIHSRVRSQIKGDAKPIYRGYAVWRSTIEFDASGLDLDSPTETFGKGRRVGLVPIGKNRFYWYATNNQPENSILPPEQRKAQLLEFFQDWHAPIPQIIAATDAEDILHNDCYDRLPEPGWSQGRVCLIGDAAHPTTPNLGQGGCMALEDAVVLTKCLQNSAEPSEAFREFEAQRFPRTKFITERSLMLGKVGQWQNPLAVFVRNTLTRLTPKKSLEKNFEPIYSFRA